MQTDWESRYRSNDTPWDKGEASPGLVEFLRTHPIHGCVLVPGCGFGHAARAIGRGSAGRAEVLGLDIAPSAVRGATAISACDASGGIYETGDFLALPEKCRGAFDWVWEHTCFCAIPPDQREQYAGSVASALKPGGRFLGVFYLNPELAPGEQGPPFGVTTRELDALFEGAFELMRDWVPAQTFPNRAGRERMRLYVKRGRGGCEAPPWVTEGKRSRPERGAGKKPRAFRLQAPFVSV